MAGIPAMIGTALEYAPYAISAGKTAYSLGQKYLPKVKSLANNLFSAPKRRSAMDYMRNLTNPKGMKKLITKDIPSVAKGASNLISSGKLLKGAQEIAGDANTMLNASQKLIGDKYHSQATSLVNKGMGQAERFHDIASKYNEHGKQLANQLYSK